MGARCPLFRDSPKYRGPQWPYRSVRRIRADMDGRRGKGLAWVWVGVLALLYVLAALGLITCFTIGG